MSREDKYQEMLTILGHSFDRQVVSDPTFLDGVPRGAYVALQVMVDATASREMRVEIAGFNDWSMRIAKSHLADGQDLCVARFALRPLVIQASESLTNGVLETACDAYDLVPA